MERWDWPTCTRSLRGQAFCAPSIFVVVARARCRVAKNFKFVSVIFFVSFPMSSFVRTCTLTKQPFRLEQSSSLLFHRLVDLYINNWITVYAWSSKWAKPSQTFTRWNSRTQSNSSLVSVALLFLPFFLTCLVVLNLATYSKCCFASSSDKGKDKTKLSKLDHLPSI